MFSEKLKRMVASFLLASMLVNSNGMQSFATALPDVMQNEAENKKDITTRYYEEWKSENTSNSFSEEENSVDDDADITYDEQISPEEQIETENEQMNDEPENDNIKNDNENITETEKEDESEEDIEIDETTKEEAVENNDETIENKTTETETKNESEQETKQETEQIVTEEITEESNEIATISNTEEIIKKDIVATESEIEYINNIATDSTVEDIISTSSLATVSETEDVINKKNKLGAVSGHTNHKPCGASANAQCTHVGINAAGSIIDEHPNLESDPWELLSGPEVTLKAADLTGWKYYCLPENGEVTLKYNSYISNEKLTGAALEGRIAKNLIICLNGGTLNLIDMSNQTNSFYQGGIEICNCKSQGATVNIDTNYTIQREDYTNVYRQSYGFTVGKFGVYGRYDGRIKINVKKGFVNAAQSCNFRYVDLVDELSERPYFEDGNNNPIRNFMSAMHLFTENTNFSNMSRTIEIGIPLGMSNDIKSAKTSGGDDFYEKNKKNLVSAEFVDTTFEIVESISSEQWLNSLILYNPFDIGDVVAGKYGIELCGTVKFSGKRKCGGIFASFTHVRTSGNYSNGIIVKNKTLKGVEKNTNVYIENNDILSIFHRGFDIGKGPESMSAVDYLYKITTEKYTNLYITNNKFNYAIGEICCDIKGYVEIKNNVFFKRGYTTRTNQMSEFGVALIEVLGEQNYIYIADDERDEMVFEITGSIYAENNTYRTSDPYPTGADTIAKNVDLYVAKKAIVPIISMANKTYINSVKSEKDIGEVLFYDSSNTFSNYLYYNTKFGNVVDSLISTASVVNENGQTKIKMSFMKSENQHMHKMCGQKDMTKNDCKHTSIEVCRPIPIPWIGVTSGEELETYGYKNVYLKNDVVVRNNRIQFTYTKAICLNGKKLTFAGFSGDGIGGMTLPTIDITITNCESGGTLDINALNDTDHVMMGVREGYVMSEVGIDININTVVGGTKFYNVNIKPKTTTGFLGDTLFPEGKIFEKVNISNYKVTSGTANFRNFIKTTEDKEIIFNNVNIENSETTSGLIECKNIKFYGTNKIENITARGPIINTNDLYIDSNANLDITNNQVSMAKSGNALVNIKNVIDEESSGTIPRYIV